MTKTKKITLDHVTKVEGHAEVHIKIKDGKVQECHVHSVEGARYFESIIKGRKYDEISLITSRICGICSCGHTVASITATERALGVTPSLQSRLIRELITIGERIRSHASHLYFFVLPDFLGAGNAIELAKDHPQEIKNCLEIVRVGNALIEAFGGRDMHPFVPMVGGVTQVPDQAQVAQLKRELVPLFPLVKNTIKLFSSLDVPQYENPDTVFLSLENDKTFPLLTGDILSNTGLRFSPKDYESFVEEYFHRDSTAKFATVEGKAFMTGALARINQAEDRLSPEVLSIMKKYKSPFPTTNLFHNNLAQALEIYHWLLRAVEILDAHSFAPEKPKKVDLKQGPLRGISAIEVPRGILFHDYEFNRKGVLKKANIITPTVQNLAEMEASVKAYLNQVISKNPRKSKAKLQLEIEKMIRAFDPCFSCSTHFLEVKWEEIN